MRKLNTKNKAYIVSLLVFVVIVFIATAVFAYYKIKDMNIKYTISKDSYLYNSKKELIYITDDTYAKKDFIGRYYVVVDGLKVYLGNNAIIYNASSRNVTLLGIFYEILKTSEVEKLKGESIISCTNANRIFKVDDRKYLLVGPNIKSSDGIMTATDYVIIELDKVGNGYIYNKDMNIKSFKDIVIDTGDFELKVNEEKLLFGDTEVNLSSINGSTNEYNEKKKKNNGSSGGNGGGGDSGLIDNGGNAGNQNTEQIIKEEKYVARKTSIVNTSSTIDTITINYVVYDPFIEYKGLYLVLFDENNEKLGSYEMDMSLTSYTIINLKAHKNYRMNFYYIYQDETGNNVDTLFDTVNVQTKNFKAHLSLEMITDDSVRYILRVDDGYVLDSASVELSILNDDDEVVSTSTHQLENQNLVAASGNDGFSDTFSNVEFEGAFVKLTLKNCKYQGENVDITASYKFKI